MPPQSGPIRRRRTAVVVLEQTAPQRQEHQEHAC